MKIQNYSRNSTATFGSLALYTKDFNTGCLRFETIIVQQLINVVLKITLIAGKLYNRDPLMIYWL